MEYPKIISTEYFNIYYLPNNSVYFCKFNKLYEGNDFSGELKKHLRFFQYDGDVVIDYRGSGLFRQYRFVKLLFINGSLIWERHKEIDGLDILKECVDLGLKV